MADRLPIGTCVICKPNQAQWAVRVFPELNGKHGVVQEFREGVRGFDRDRYLVGFDEQVAQSFGWWLDVEEVIMAPERKNREGVTFAEWRAAAEFGGYPLNDGTARKAWSAGEDPTEYAAEPARAERKADK